MATSSARARYAAACIALSLMLAMPAVTVWRLTTPAEPAAHGISFGAQESDAARFHSPLVPASGDRLSRLAPWIVLGWLAGVSLLSVRLLGGFLAAARLKHRRTRAVARQWELRLAELARRLRVSQSVRLLQSALVEVPTAIGILRPVILLPAGIATGLSGSQLDSLLAHELAHIRRRDCLVNLIQAFAETFLFYHPAVWWVSHRIRVERENACDDLAVAATGDAAAYARALVELEERRENAPRLAVAADGGRLWDRITRLFPTSEGATSRSPGWLAAALAVCGVLALGTAVDVASPGAEHGSTSLAAPATPEPEPAPQPTPEAAAEELPAAKSSDRETGEVVETGASSRGLLSPEQLIAFRIHGVTPEFIRQIKALGFEKASPEALVALRIHGVTPDYIAQMTALFGKLPLEDYTALRIHGLTPESLEELRALFGKLSQEEALALRIHGVNAPFVKAFREAGYNQISADEAVSLRIHGVDPADAAGWKSLGFEAPSIDELLSLRIHGVTPESVRAMRSLGLADLSLDDALSFRIHGVTPEFLREIRGLGYASITADELTAFRIHGLTPEDIRAMNRKAGRQLSADELIERRIHGDEEADQ